MTEVNQLAISEDTIKLLFIKLRDGFKREKRDGVTLGQLSLSYAAGIKLENGDIDLQADGSVRLDRLDIVFDPLSFTRGVELPEICVGGQCIASVGGKCVVRLPKICVFGDNPDLSITYDLSRLIRLEVSGECEFRGPKYFTNPAKGTQSDWEAHSAGNPNEWRLFLHPRPTAFRFRVDIAGTVEDILRNIIKDFVDGLFKGLPGWARSAINSILGGLANAVGRILNLGSDIRKWVEDHLRVSLDLFDLALGLLLEYLATLAPIFKFEDPYPVFPGEIRFKGPRLVPVLVPIKEPTIIVDDHELTLSANFGV